MIGEKIHSYQVNAHLGQGGMGTVFRATDTMLGREVALKMLHPQLTMQPLFLDRFKKEARVLAQLLHPNIAVIYNFIEQGGNHFMVIEYVEGTNLDDLLKKHKALPLQFVVPVFIQALEGLQHAHKKNIFHRDIKPANLMLTPDGTIKLMDFGIAKVAGEQKVTQVNKIVGTVEFMAPELIQGKDASSASDIYAMGVTLYEMILGKLPFESDTDFNLMQAILKKKISPPDKLNAAVPKVLSDIIMKAVDKKPENRYADARAFQQALVTAFPGYGYINLQVLNAVNVAKKPVNLKPGAATQPNANFSTATAIMQTKLATPANSFSVVQKIKTSIESNKKYWLIAAACLFILITGSMILRKSNKIIIAKTDSTKQQKQILPEVNTGNLKDEIIVQQKTAAILPPPENKNQQIVPEQIKPPIEKQPVEKAKEKKIVAKEKIKEAGIKEEKKKQAEEEPPEKPVEKKEVYISSKVEISLYLRDNLDNAPERKDIPVNFTVSNPVVYQGVTIIKQGAVASGVIKLGKIQTDIDINYVTAANGQQIGLKTLHNHGRRKEITSNRSYAAFIKPGIRLSF
jgi:serine/threonine protein kinase